MWPVLSLVGLAAFAANPAIDGNRFVFTGVDGGACLEFTTAASFRLVRWWGPAAPVFGDPVLKDRLWTKSDDKLTLVSLETKYLHVDVNKDDYRLTVRLRGAEAKLLWAERRGPHRQADGQLILDSALQPEERIYGFGAPVQAGNLDQRGRRFKAAAKPFYFSSGGYGRYLARFGDYDVDAGLGEPTRLRITAARPAAYVDQYFYYGPSPKEVLEQHMLSTQSQVHHPDTVLALATVQDLPSDFARAPVADANYCDLPLAVNQLSLSGAIYTAFDLSKLSQHADDLRFYPFLYRSDGASGGAEIELRRRAWLPYHRTYLREAYDRGLPLLRPLVMQYPRDKGMEKHSSVFMVGDELLVAPGCGVKTIELPRGRWTDLRTNKEYPGRTIVANDTKGLPVFVKMGSVLPLATRGGSLELHYYPNIGAEFFLIEPEVGEYSQFHGSPAGDIIRVETESKVDRRCEWVIHHVERPSEVSEGDAKFQESASKGELAPGAWFYDAGQRTLHIVIDAKAGEDRIVNSSFMAKPKGAATAAAAAKKE